MRSIAILLVLFCMAVVRAGPTSHDASAATNSAVSSHKPSVYVGGNVQKPGRYDWFPGMTVVDAIQAAGGFEDSTGHLAFIMRIEGGYNIRINFDADKFPYGVKQPPLLKDGDTVSVPRRII
jgi:polysaccharide export outer membrane protein